MTAVELIPHTWITLADGTRLSARLWLPADRPAPAVVDCIPYRHSDGTTASDERLYGELAGNGYACVRVDIRGSGNSDGILTDEYLPQEQDDAAEVIGWAAAQPWCTGAVGYMGVSWGGFVALQLAARQPPIPALGAVIAICASDDRYADDVHYIGGCVQTVDMLPWASYMLVHNALPPDPDIVGDDWRQTWLRRADETPPFVEAWLSHQRRDAYWTQGSVGDDPDRIGVPVYAIGGWSDGYSDGALRLAANLPAGRGKALIGPWSHGYPDQALPGPHIDFAGECVRWWDHWLRGVDTGLMEEPRLRVWMQETTQPSTRPRHRPGRWVAEPDWSGCPPSPPLQLFIADDVLVSSPPANGSLHHVDTELVGQAAGPWCPASAPGDWPGDQRAEDGRSMSFTSAPLDEPVEMLGFAEVTLELSVDRPEALLAVRLCEVDSAGRSLLVSRGVLNLTHRNGHDRPTVLRPGERETVTVRFKGTAHRFSAGNRIRLSLSTTYWPWAWPSPEPLRLELFVGPSVLRLPVRAPRPDDDRLRGLGEPKAFAPSDSTGIRRGRVERVWTRDASTGRTELRTVRDGGRRRLRSTGMEVEFSETVLHRLIEGAPLTAEVQCDNVAERAHGGWQVSVRSSSTMSSTADAFLVSVRLEGFEAKGRVFDKAWSWSFPRDAAE